MKVLLCNLLHFFGEILLVLNSQPNIASASCQLLKKANFTTDEHDDADLSIQMDLFELLIRVSQCYQCYLW